MSDKKPIDEAFLKKSGYIACRLFSDGSYVAVMPTSKGQGRLVIGYNEYGYDEGWCYHTTAEAIAAMNQWNPEMEDEPGGWFRRPLSGCDM